MFLNSEVIGIKRHQKKKKDLIQPSWSPGQRNFLPTCFCWHRRLCPDHHPNQHWGKPSVWDASVPGTGFPASPSVILLQPLTTLCSGYCYWSHFAKQALRRLGPNQKIAELQNWTQTIIWLQNLCFLACCVQLFVMLWTVRLASHGWKMRWWRAAQGNDLVCAYGRGSGHYHHQGNF